MRGAIILGYEELSVVDGQINIKNPKYTISICDETNRAGDLFWTESTKPDVDGVVFNTYYPIQWRPIWFTRTTLSPVGTIIVKVIGAQTTLPPEYGGKNVKKLVSIFPDNTLGID